jgi:hypothetical protein
VNINHTGFERGYAEKNIPVGPVKIKLSLKDFNPAKVTATEDKQKVELSRDKESFTLTLERLFVHQLIIVEQ